jgi:SAM-dependent methyltransferase
VRASLSKLWNEPTLTGESTYFEYERRLGTEVVLPWLERRIDLSGLTIGDFGCHQGGVLDALRGDGRARGGIGFDANAANLAASPFEPDERFALEQRDLLTLSPGEYRFDLILLSDVLEHVREPELMMRIARDNLAPDGRVLVTFPPYWSPFGGHQQLASNWVRLTPYVHYLPDSALFKLAKLGDTNYMKRDDAIADMRDVRRTRLTLRKAERAFAEAGLRVAASELFLLRPEYSVRYSLRPRTNRLLGAVPALREIVTMGAYYLLADGRPA